MWFFVCLFLHIITWCQKGVLTVSYLASGSGAQYIPAILKVLSVMKCVDFFSLCR